MRHYESGFSLLEVTVSMTLSSLAALALSLSTTTGYRLVRETERRTLAHQAALNTLEQLRLTDPKSAPLDIPAQTTSLGPFFFYIQSRISTPTTRKDWWIVDVSVYSSTGGNAPTRIGAPITTLRTAMVPWNKR